MSTIEYAAEVRHDGRRYEFVVPNLEIAVCGSCSEKVFTEDVDRQISDSLRSHLRLMTPQQIRDAINRLGTSQKELARQLSIAEATLSRWLNETQIQSRAMDKVLRTYFAFPDVRAALSDESGLGELGLSDIVPSG